jgi:syntaxin 16
MLPEEMDQPEPTSAEDVLFGLPPGTNAMSSQQMLVFADNKIMADEREEEMRKIVSSIVDLNSIFKDLAHMVVEQVTSNSSLLGITCLNVIIFQGTVLDRIDYNVERTTDQVSQGLKQLQKAERYQRSNRKMKCILCMAVTVVVLLFLLVIVKT